MKKRSRKAESAPLVRRRSVVPLRDDKAERIYPARTPGRASRWLQDIQNSQ